MVNIQRQDGVYLKLRDRHTGSVTPCFQKAIVDSVGAVTKGDAEPSLKP